MGLADNLFNEIYDTLVIYHQQNESIVVDKKIVKAKTINKLKKILIEENIQFVEDDNRLLCTLNEKKREIAEKVYTFEVVKKLEEEKRRSNDLWLSTDF